jgi:beta-glucosidase
VSLEPGESREVSFTIDAETLSFYRADMSYGPESGDFKVFIGGASDKVREASFRYEE